MFKIIKKEKIAENTYSLQIHAPKIAKSAKAGQFVIIQIDETGERIPLTIADYNKTSVTIIFLVIGHTTTKLSKLRKGQFVKDFVGPLGNPTEIEEFGDVCVVGGGLGIAATYPIVKEMSKKNNVIAIIGAKSKKHLFWLEKFEKVCDKLIICTDDGSIGQQGFVTTALKSYMRNNHLARVITVGPGIMMKSVSDLTKSRVRTVASLNPIIVDGIGMCGSCRITVAGETKFACVDGPEFNAHDVDWCEFLNRLNRFSKEEKHICRIRK